MIQRTCVGLDVHARSVVGHGIDPETGEVFRRNFDGVDVTADVVAWLASLPGPVGVVYETGPTGYGLCRAIRAAGMDCQVAAASKLLPAPGTRVKTDKRDARHLAELLIAGLVSPIRVPPEHEEALRDLIRARDDARRDLLRARHRLSKLLLRHGKVFCGKRTWTRAHYRWLETIRFDQPELQATFDNNFTVVNTADTRLAGLDKQVMDALPGSGFEDVVRALCCLRGVAELTAFSLAVEIGDWSRFTGSSIGSYLGLVPSEYSSGQSRRQGGITKTGNTRARRLLTEAAWQHRTFYRATSPELLTRWAKADPAWQALGDKANHRLHHQWAKFDKQGKRNTVANTAIARELAGFCWALATRAEQTALAKQAAMA